MLRHVLMVASLTFAATAAAQGPTSQQGTPATARAAAVHLRQLYFAQDHAAGAALAPDLMRRFGSDPEVAAWSVLALARSGADIDALNVAGELARAHPRSFWSGFAHAFAVAQRAGQEQRAIGMARDLYARARNNRDAIWLYGFVLHNGLQYREVVALADSVARRMSPWAELLVLKGNALAALSNRPPADTALRRDAAETFAQARRLDPLNVNAHYLPAANLSTDPASDSLLQRAIALSPLSPTIRGVHWRRIRARRDLQATQKDSIIIAEVEALLAARPRVPMVLHAAANEYGTSKRTQERRALEDRILTEFPSTAQAEYVFLNRVRALQDTAWRGPATDSARARAQAAQMVREFMHRTVHHSSGQLGNTTLDYYRLLADDSTVSADSLKRFGERFVELNRWNPHLTHLELPMKVAERKGDFRWAERLVRVGDSIRKADTERDRDYIVQRGGVAEYAERLDMQKAMTHDAIGWIYAQENRYDDAEREFEKARELVKSHPQLFFHLGQLAEMRGLMAEAQAHYAKGYALESSYTRRQNQDALKRIYVHNSGSMDGFDAYVARLKEEDRQRRRQKIVDSRIADAQEIPDFSLERYPAPGPRVTRAHLDGKIAVINFWGVWCGPCVKEIPEIQKFHEAVKNDTSVVFLTVDYNDTPETLDDFMKKRKLDFAVLYDADRWASDKAKITAYPTTWFVDRDGKLAYRHIGASDVVVEEFLWRVELLKAGPLPKP